MAELPTGTVTFLFTDIEGSTKLAQLHPAAWESARLRHHAIVRAAAESHRGYVFQVIGDAFCIAYATAPDALACALETQHALQAEPWGEMPIHVRMGLHTGAAELRDGDYHGYLTLAHVQRVMSAAYGGQTLVSDAAASLLRRQLAEGVTLRNIGEHRLKGLLNAEPLWQLVAPDLPSDFPALPSLNAIPNNLPIQVTSFIGRERELSELKRLLPTTRLLTLTGSGGTGKTRLSLQVAAEVLDNFSDGVWLVELAPLSDAALLPLTIASVLGVRAEPGRPPMETLLEWLRPKKLLLILDNCEHLIDACANFADAVIHASRELRILASSREALGIAGELAWRVPSFPTPNPAEVPTIAQLEQFAAVRLFVERASFALPAFALTNANAPAVAQICYRLDGIPLAIELAAARVKSMRVEQIAQRLDDHFRLLTGGSRTALARQQTLRSLVDWSHSLLSEPERILLRRLSVFVGGWTLEAAEEVTKDEGGRMKDEIVLPSSFILHPSHVLDLLSHLVDKSLVILDQQTAAPRYQMLETIRHYAREKLLDANETTVIRDRHLTFFLRLAEETEPHLSGPAQAMSFARLESEYTNMRAALEWSLHDSDASHGMRFTSALFLLWQVRGPLMEGVDWLVRVLSRAEAEAPSVVEAKALFATARVLSAMGELVQSNSYAEQSLAVSRALDYRPGEARALLQLGINARWQGNFNRSKPLLEQSLAIREGLIGSDLALLYIMLGWIAAYQGDYDGSHKYFELAMSVAQAAQDSQSVAFTFGQIGTMALMLHDYAGAEAAFEQGLNVGRIVGHIGAVGVSARGLAYVALQRGQVTRAAALCRESLLISRQRGDPWTLAASLSTCAALSVVRIQPERAARLYGSTAVRLIGTVDGRHRYPHDQAAQERYLAILHTQLDEATFNAEWEAGRTLTLDDAIALALEETDG